MNFAIALALTAVPVASQPASPVGPPMLLEDVLKDSAGPLHVSMQVFQLPAAPAGRTLEQLPGHRHPGHVYVYVLEGQVRSSLDEGPGRLFSAGQVWLEQPGQLHKILNPVPGTTARLLVVMVEPARK